MHHSIWVPATDTIRAKVGGQATLEGVLSAAGLADHAGMDGLYQVEGPTDINKGGWLFWRQPDGVMGFDKYVPEKQTWLKSCQKGDTPPGLYWVGVWNDSPPTEGELRRAYREPGKTLRIEEQDWLVPRPQELPRTARLSDDGSFRFEVQRKFETFFHECAWWSQQIEDVATKEDAEYAGSDERAMEFMLQAVQINYRMPIELACYMGLLRTDLFVPFAEIVLVS